MSFSYDRTTPIGKVRLLIADSRADEARFQDEDIQMFLDLYVSISPLWKQLKLAAADAQDATAADQNLLLKAVLLRRTEVQTNGPAVARELRAHAARLRQDVVNNLMVIAGQPAAGGTTAVCTSASMV